MKVVRFDDTKTSLQMMTQGGNIRDYSSPNTDQEKYSPTGRKISVDSKVRLHSRHSTSGYKHHTYENLPSLSESISTTERHKHPPFDTESTTV